MNGIISLLLSKTFAKKYTDNKFDAVASGLVYKGSVQSTSDLPTASSSNKGWEYSVTSNNGMYVSDGSSWVSVKVDGDNFYTKTETQTYISEHCLTI